MSSENLNDVVAILKEYDNDPNKLIPILQKVQHKYNYLPQEAMACVAEALGIPPSKVYGVATFFSHFSTVPKGKHIIKVCNGTACHVKKSEGLIHAVKKRLNLTGEKLTTDDAMFTLEIVACLGACGIAPVAVMDGEVHPRMTPDAVVSIIDAVAQKEKANVKN